MRPSSDRRNISIRCNKPWDGTANEENLLYYIIMICLGNNGEVIFEKLLDRKKRLPITAIITGVS